MSLGIDGPEWFSILRWWRFTSVGMAINVLLQPGLAIGTEPIWLARDSALLRAEGFPCDNKRLSKISLS